MKRFLVLSMCVMFLLCVTAPAFAQDAPKAPAADAKAKAGCTHNKDCAVCKEKGKANCDTHKSCCEKKAKGKRKGRD